MNNAYKDKRLLRTVSPYAMLMSFLSCPKSTQGGSLSGVEFGSRTAPHGFGFFRALWRAWMKTSQDDHGRKLFEEL